MSSYHRSPLKWAGNKYQILSYLTPHLTGKPSFIEPFMGSGVIFLNTSFEQYKLYDINADLIHFYTQLSQQGKTFIDFCQYYFQPCYNQKSAYYTLREQFNHTPKNEERARLFLYLNRHGFNGLCRYNQKGGFNVPFGQYVKPYFPEKEMVHFYEKSQSHHLILSTEPFNHAMNVATSSDIVYCDPPYLPIDTFSSHFTQYASMPFLLQHHEILSRLAYDCYLRGCRVILSNHDTELTRELYKHATIESFLVKRYISARKSSRVAIKELLAVYA
jgi:DNA adenine methylase